MCYQQANRIKMRWQEEKNSAKNSYSARAQNSPSRYANMTEKNEKKKEKNISKIQHDMMMMLLMMGTREMQIIMIKVRVSFHSKKKMELKQIEVEATIH